VETLLKHQDAPHISEYVHDTPFVTTDADPHLYIANRESGPLAMQIAHNRSDSIPRHEGSLGLGVLGDSTMGNTDPSLENISLGWDMMSLGVEEALPTPEVQEALCVVPSSVIATDANVPTTDITYFSTRSTQPYQ